MRGPLADQAELDVRGIVQTRHGARRGPQLCRIHKPRSASSAAYAGFAAFVAGKPLRFVTLGDLQDFAPARRRYAAKRSRQEVAS